MSDGDSHLEQIQRWMQSVITHRGGVSEGVDSPEARQHLDVTLADLEHVIRRSRALSSADRLEIYVNAYYARLMECLNEEFAVTRYALGEELFDAVTFGYLQSYPSHSYTLGDLGATFSRYLAESRIHAAAMPADAAGGWPEFVAELATLERALYEVYDGPGTERDGPLDLADLERIAPDEWGAVRLVAAPCLRLLQFDHPVHEYWGQRKDGGQPAPPAPRRTNLALNRHDYIVERHELDDAQFALLDDLVRGATLFEALAAAGTAAEPQIGEWFARWASAGFFSSMAQQPE